MSASIRPPLGTGIVSYPLNLASEKVDQEKEVKKPGMFDWLINHPTTKLIGGIAVIILINWAVGQATNKTFNWASKSISTTENAESPPHSNILSVFTQKISHSDSTDRGVDDPNGGNPRDPREDRGRAHEPQRSVPDKEHRHRPEKK